MGKFSTDLLKAWLAIPRWFKMFALNAITIYVLWTLFIDGINNIFRLDISSLMISLAASGIILAIFNKTSVKN